LDFPIGNEKTKDKNNNNNNNNNNNSEGGEPKAGRALGSTAELSLHGWLGDFIIFTLPYCPSFLKK